LVVPTHEASQSHLTSHLKSHQGSQGLILEFTPSCCSSQFHSRSHFMVHLISCELHIPSIFPQGSHEIDLRLWGHFNSIPYPLHCTQCFALNQAPKSLKPSPWCSSQFKPTSSAWEYSLSSISVKTSQNKWLLDLKTILCWN